LDVFEMEVAGVHYDSDTTVELGNRFYCYLQIRFSWKSIFDYVTIANKTVPLLI